MSKLKEEKLLERLEEWRNLARIELANLWKVEDEQAYKQIVALIKILFAKEISEGPIKKDISQPDLVQWLQGINQAATAVKDYYVMKATTQLIETIQKPGVTEEWTKKKAMELHRYAESFQTSVEDFQDYIRKLVEEMPVKKMTVNKELINKYADLFREDYERGFCARNNYKGRLKQFSQEAGVEVVEK